MKTIPTEPQDWYDRSYVSTTAFWKDHQQFKHMGRDTILLQTWWVQMFIPILKIYNAMPGHRLPVSCTNG